MAFEVRFESLRQARFIALGLGSGARTLGPEEFPQEAARELAKMIGS
jgi:hypothetical protein